MELGNPTAGLFITLLFIRLSCTALTSWFRSELKSLPAFYLNCSVFDREHIAMQQPEDADFDNLVVYEPNSVKRKSYLTSLETKNFGYYNRRGRLFLFEPPYCHPICPLVQINESLEMELDGTYISKPQYGYIPVLND